jgi:hypothetical protein
MEKKFFIACIAILGFASAQAQFSMKPGIRAGLNFSRFSSSDTSVKTDFFVGGTVALKFNKLYTLQPEISYSRQGAKVDIYYQSFDPVYDPYISQRTGAKLSLDYVTLGIINKFTFGKGFQVMVGPSLDFKVYDNFAVNNTQTPIDFDLSIVAGIGYAFPNGITIDARLKGGVIDIFGYDNYVTTDSYYNNNGHYSYDEFQNILNEVIQLGVSYSFDLKGSK